MKIMCKKLLFLFFLLPFCVLSQNTIKGVVLDSSSGQAMAGVNVNIQGEKNGVSTDFDGKFQISNVKQGDKILVSFIGYKNEIITISS